MIDSLIFVVASFGTMPYAIILGYAQALRALWQGRRWV